jgi:cellulose synthase/poly-beta-1,6-N-acetylglucosamine synthase-like glycosyltransferase
MWYLIYPKNKTLPDRPSTLPFVTVQLPVYNERYVVARLIDSICKLKYPKDKMQIMVLDDSTDDTTKICEEKCMEYRRLGFSIEHIHRKVRSGYKAGALSESMPYTTGEFIAIFDADFIPDPNFLMETIPHFDNEHTGIVQCRWGHINEGFSMLTAVQAFQLNVHFTAEQKGRQNSGSFLQFNGTAGVWRKKCIESAGGWHADTLTEDLDLSYRAQMKGWKIEYLAETVSLGELPSDIKSLKSQQHRWMKGGVENAKKLLPKMWNSDKTIYVKINGFLHLLSSSVFIFVFLLSVFSIPLTFLHESSLFLNKTSKIALLPSLMVLSIIYWISNYYCKKKSTSFYLFCIKYTVTFPALLVVSMGMAFHNFIAVIEGWIGQKSNFVRTPKYGTLNSKIDLSQSQYYKTQFSWKEYVEFILFIMFISCVLFALKSDEYTFTYFHMMAAMGYGYVTMLNLLGND